MRRLVSRVALAAIGFALVASGNAPQASASQRSCDNAQGCILMLSVNGLIDAVEVDFITSAVAEVQDVPAYRNVILAVNSPGFVDTDEAFNTLVTFLSNSKVPVSAWVGPSGAKAEGGAAELVLTLNHVGVAPSTSLGNLGHYRLTERARLRSAAMTPVLLSETSGDQQLVDSKIVDALQPTVGDHVLSLPGMPTRETKDDEGRPKRELVVDAVTQTLPIHNQLFHTVASPAVAYLLLLTGLGLLLFEFFTAGVGVAGVVGAGCVLLAGYGLDSLPARGWAVGLIVFSAFAFAIDIQTAIPRFWTGVGLLTCGIGSVFLVEGFRVPIIALVAGLGGMAIAMISGMPSMVRARFATPTIGREYMIGQIGHAETNINPEGTANIGGGLWRAITHREQPLEPGDELEVVSIDGMTLEVAPVGQAPVDYRELRGSAKAEAARED